MAEAFESIHNDDIGPVIGKFTASGALVDGIDVRSMEAVRVSNLALRYEFVASKARAMQDAERGVKVKKAYDQGPEALAAAIGYVIVDESTQEGKKNMDTCRELIALRESKIAADAVCAAPTVSLNPRSIKEQLESEGRVVHTVSIEEAHQVDNKANMIFWRPNEVENALVVEG